MPHDRGTRTSPVLGARPRGLTGARASALVVVHARAVDAKADVHPEWGTTSAKRNGVLKRSCRNYRYSYAITPPDAGDWALETFLIGPGARRLASDGFVDGFDPLVGQRHAPDLPSSPPGPGRLQDPGEAGRPSRATTPSRPGCR